MSKDQLSWENLLLSTPAETSAPSADVVVDANKTEPVNASAKKTRTKKLNVENTEISNDEKRALNVSQKTAQPLKMETTGSAEKEIKVDFSLNEEPPAPTILSISDLNRGVKDLLEGKFKLVWVQGEISNFKPHTSGHFYFSLKDSKAQISAVMFRGFNSQLKYKPQDGMEVLVRGRISVYEPRGSYQIFCETMEPVGAGALQKAFEQLKAQLAKEGLFSPDRKRPLPQLPKHIAIVTSPTGAAIRDMLNVLGRRFRGAQITVIPTKVQGDQAPAEIVTAIQMANRLSDVDVMIVGRGGGSIEDLWAFNDERVARAIAASKIPTVSAVGHEVDFTIADFVADLRAPTPSAAAELVVKNAGDLQIRILDIQKRLRQNMRTLFTRIQQHVNLVSRRLVDPQRRIQDASIRSDELSQRLEAAVYRYFQDQRNLVELLVEKLGSPQHRVDSQRQKVESLNLRINSSTRSILQRQGLKLGRMSALLDSLSPLRVVARGYSFVTHNGEVIKDVEQLAPGQILDVQFAVGRIEAEVKTVLNTKKVLE